MLRTKIFYGGRRFGIQKTFRKMALKAKRGRSRNVNLLLCAGVGLCAMYYLLQYKMLQEAREELDMGRSRSYIESSIQEALLLDKGSGCSLPELDPFAAEVTQFDKHLPRIQCKGQDWVRCYHSKCRVVDAIKTTVNDISCEYRDILYHSDQNYTIGSPTKVVGGDEYWLVASDHVKVACTGRQRLSRWINFGSKTVGWSGYSLGFRPVARPPTPSGREDTFNVILLCLDTTARNGFIRRMPKSWQALKDLGFTVMEGFNVLGDGTPAALFPILTGKTELELPDVRKSKHSNATMDSFPFIYYKLKPDGYRTAYFEDLPYCATFQYRFNGFRRHPADHNIRPFFLETVREDREKWAWLKTPYCTGDTPTFKLMLNTTLQFMELDGKRFVFTIISDITHDDFNLIESADEDTVNFLRSAMRWADDTLIVVFGDHGPRYSHVRATLQGKLEERLPLLAIRLPSRLTLSRRAAQRALEQNARALTTPHDLHATILDVLRMSEHRNPYTVPGADMKRGLSMLEPVNVTLRVGPRKIQYLKPEQAEIPLSRSCSEAGIEPHWCACLKWQNVSDDDPFYDRTGQALIDFINELFHGEFRSLCAPRTLTSIEWVLRHRPNSRLLAFAGARDADGYVGHFNAKTIVNEIYQVKIVAGPGLSVFEASMTYLAQEDKFVLSTRAISRTNAYGTEPACISATHPFLNPYCYCR